MLENAFQQHRLVFWYDDKGEWASHVEEMEIANVEKLTIENNEFGIKYKVLIEKPQQRFLLYQASPHPADNENWLLDLVLAYHTFKAETSTLQLQALNLSEDFRGLVEEHHLFFYSQKRIAELKELVETADTDMHIKLKMLYVICGCVQEWEEILYTLFTEIYKNKQDKYKTIEKIGLATFLWDILSKKYAYDTPTPSIKDFLIQLIQDNFQRSLPNGKPNLNKEAYLFVNRWKENNRLKLLFIQWSQLLQKELGIEHTIQEIAGITLIEADTYPTIDQKVLSELKIHILQNTLPNHILQEYIEKRRNKFFFEKYQQIYEALSFASSLLDEIRKQNIKIASPEEGFQKYASQLYKIDRLYRKYIYSSEKASHQDFLKPLTAYIEKAYGNTFLIVLGDNWQSVVDGMETWLIPTIKSQKQFYTTWVTPYIQKENRVFIIISDALRYESATELKELILQEDRYTAELHAVLGALPSYTQLGMASLLPNTTFSFNDASDTVYVDEMSSQGTTNRSKILQKYFGGSTAIGAEDFLKMNAKTQGRDFIKPYNVIYIYSNHIDKIGDDKTSEGKVFEATETEFDNLLKIVKQIANMNGTNILITADHGYLYQHNRLEASDFTDFNPSGKVYKSSRRFVLGKELGSNESVKKWKGEQLGFSDDTQAIIPKSINRIRIQGAGSRFVHGGASLQEIVIPVLEINKTRKSNVGQVEIDIISGSTHITSNTFAISFYQKQAIADKLQPRQLKIGFYTSTDRLISNLITLVFNSSDNDTNAREKKQNFVFTAESSNYNGQDVYLKLTEQIEGTNQLKLYKQFTYRMLIAYSGEFDDF